MPTSWSTRRTNCWRIRSSWRRRKAELLARLAGATGERAYGIYREASPELKAEKDLALAALKAVGSLGAADLLAHAPPGLLTDKQFWLEATALNARYLTHAPTELRTDTDVVRVAYGVDNTDRQAVLAKLAEDAEFLRHVPGELLRVDPEVVAAAKGALLARLAGAMAATSLFAPAAANAPGIYCGAPPELKGEKDVVLAALKAAGRYAAGYYKTYGINSDNHASQILREAPAELLTDRQAVLARGGGTECRPLAARAAGAADRHGARSRGVQVRPGSGAGEAVGGCQINAAAHVAGAAGRQAVLVGGGDAAPRTSGPRAGRAAG